jgi:hypothetical protein
MTEEERAELQAVATIAAGLMAHYANNDDVCLSEIREYAWDFYDKLKAEFSARRCAEFVRRAVDS